MSNHDEENFPSSLADMFGEGGEKLGKLFEDGEHVDLSQGPHQYTLQGNSEGDVARDLLGTLTDRVMLPYSLYPTIIQSKVPYLDPLPVLTFDPLHFASTSTPIYTPLDVSPYDVLEMHGSRSPLELASSGDFQEESYWDETVQTIIYKVRFPPFDLCHSPILTTQLVFIK